MLKHRWTDRICCIALAVMLLLTGALMGAQSAGLIAEADGVDYQNRLFDQSRVHTIEITMDDWEGFLETCTNEEYAPCTVAIDGEVYANVGLRAKGNTSLSSVKQFGNNRYSFKIEFDQYSPGGSYYGLDKLSLNNVIQDYTYMKDYITYTMMNKMGVAAPLCSFAQIIVNGEEWGLYLAVEAVEDGFLRRNYGTDAGELYKPDSMSLGGGRGNGRDFDMEAFAGQLDGEEMQGLDPGQMENFAPPETGAFDPSQMSEFDHAQMGEFDPSQMGDFAGRNAPGDRGGMGGKGSADVKLQYADDDPDSYPNIFGNAKTDISAADQDRLIAALKALSEGDPAAVDAEAVMRYLAVHDFVCNGDSYTGSMVHNYYLYEEDGALSMIPWDYNLAMGGFNMGRGGDATGVVNSPIDTPVTDGELSDRPMVAWIFNDEQTVAEYHAIYDELICGCFESGWFEQTVSGTAALIAPYVESDPTKFYTYEQFETGVEALKQFGALRAQSVRGQLEGAIPSTKERQSADGAALVDASGLNLSDMGEFGHGNDRGEGKENRGQFNRKTRPGQNTENAPGETVAPEAGDMPEGMAMPEAGATPEGMTPPERGAMPEGMTPPEMGMMPEGMSPPEMGDLPGNASVPEN